MNRTCPVHENGPIEKYKKTSRRIRPHSNVVTGEGHVCIFHLFPIVIVAVYAATNHKKFSAGVAFQCSSNLLFYVVMVSAAIYTNMAAKIKRTKFE